MRRRADPQEARAHETLVYFAWLRQMETPCPALRETYERLIEAASRPGRAEARTVLLDWLERELGAARALGEEAGRRCTELMRAAVALSTALKQ